MIEHCSTHHNFIFRSFWSQYVQGHSIFKKICSMRDLKIHVINLLGLVFNMRSFEAKNTVFEFNYQDLTTFEFAWWSKKLCFIKWYLTITKNNQLLKLWYLIFGWVLLLSNIFENLSSPTLILSFWIIMYFISNPNLKWNKSLRKLFYF